MNTSTTTKFPTFEEIIRIKGLQLQATYTVGDLAKIFNVSARAIQNRVASGQIPARDLPGRAKFLPEDLEAFLSASKKKGAQRGK